MARLLTSRTLVILLLSSWLSVVVNGHGHAHDGHAHVMDENPSFRYSRQANEKYAGGPAPDNAGHHGHTHGHSHGEHHGHAHAHDDMHEQMDGGHHPSHGWRDPAVPNPDSKHRTKPNVPLPPRDNVRLWLEALGATVLISLAPFAILFVVRVDNTAEHEPMLKVLLAFASGGLLGDAFLHLIPHAIMAQSSGESGHTHSHGHTHGSGEPHQHDLAVWLWVLVGFCAFLIVEKFVRIVKGPQHHHSHSHAATPKAVTQTGEASEAKKSDKEEDGDILQKDGIRRRIHSRKEEGGDNAETAEKGSPGKDQSGETDAKSSGKNGGDNAATAGGDSPRKNEGGDSAATAGGDSPQKSDGTTTASGDLPQKLATEPLDEAKATVAVQPEIRVAGYLNLVADCIHNFTDGLAIGASFLAGEGVGIITTVTVLFHEVPHEIGDYAILIQSGCTRKQAMLMQLVTALGAISGTLFSLVAEGVGQLATAWILPFTAGGFIYIAAVSVIPELLENSTVWQSVLEILALIAGIAMMIVIAYLE